MIDPYERMKYIKSFIQAIYPKITQEDIKKSLRRINRFKQNPALTLSEDDEIILELLIRHGIKPSTAYNWYRVLGLSPYIQQEIKDRRISLTESFRKEIENNKPKKVLAEELRKDILEYVRKIAEKDFLGGGEYAVR